MIPLAYLSDLEHLKTCNLFWNQINQIFINVQIIYKLGVLDSFIVSLSSAFHKLCPDIPQEWNVLEGGIQNLHMLGIVWEIVQWLTEKDATLEVPGSFPMTNERKLTSIWKSKSEESDTYFWALWAALHMSKHTYDINKNKNKPVIK